MHPVEEGEEIKTDALHQIFTNAYNVKLRMSRSFGDFFLKQNSALPDDQQAVIAIPEIKIHPRGTR